MSIAAKPLTGAPRSPWADAVHRLRRDKLAVVGAGLLLGLMLVAILAPWLAPFDPNLQFADGTTLYGDPLPPGGRYLLGTDTLGRDTLSRLVYGSRISLQVGLISIAIAASIGTTLGLIAGYFGGWVDQLVMRLTDMMMSFPDLLLIMAIVAIRGPSLPMIFIAIGLVTWTTFARIVRSQVLTVREHEYIEAAKAQGARPSWIIVKHVLPNVVAPIIVLATMNMASAIMTEAALSFLGLGVQEPIASWGKMIQLGQGYFWDAPWLCLIPGFAIAMTVFAFNLFGDGLRDALDPRLK
ncbi:MAG: ABC transporter permease [Candidatus Sericytochromatia bacterium]|nr:ABC transporter permease [Candidatus Sericytochromatia bacterium]